MSKIYLIFLNPFSGRKNAKHIFNKYVEPQFNNHNLPFELIYTDRPNHAKDIIQKRNLGNVRAIVVLSGDGLIFEIINGLMHNIDKNAIKIPLGIIPAGTGNALHTSLCHQYNGYNKKSFIKDCVRHVIEGEPKNLDILKITIPSTGETYYSILGFTWGLIADVDNESKVHRHLGKFRFIIHGVHRIKNLRYYNGLVRYRSCGQNESEPLTNCRFLMERECINSTSRSNFIPAPVNHDFTVSKGFLRCWKPRLPYGLAHSSYQLTEPTCNRISLKKSKCTDKLDSDNQTLNRDTLNIPRGHDSLADFLALYVCNVSHISQDFSVTPTAKLNDGYAHLCILKRGIKKSQLLKFLFNISRISDMDKRFIHCVPLKYLTMTPLSIVIPKNNDSLDFGPTRLLPHQFKDISFGNNFQSGPQGWSHLPKGLLSALSSFFRKFVFCHKLRTTQKIEFDMEEVAESSSVATVSDNVSCPGSTNQDGILENKVKSMTLKDSTDTGLAIMTIDGETMPVCSIIIEVLPSMGRILAYSNS